MSDSKPIEVCLARATEVDFQIQKESYIQTQNWARHNENLIVTSNAFLFAVIGSLVAIALKDPAMGGGMLPILAGSKASGFLVPAMLSLVGLVLTLALTVRYKDSINRVVVYEALFGCHLPGQVMDPFTGASPNRARHPLGGGWWGRNWAGSWVPR